MNSQVKSATNKEITYDQFLQLLEDGNVKIVKITSSELEITPVSQNNTLYQTTYYTGLISMDTQLVARLEAANVQFYRDTSDSTSGIGYMLLTTLVPILLLWGGLFFVFRAMSKSSGGMMGVGKSTAKMYVQKETGVLFRDVAGQEEAMDSLYELVDFLHNPQKYTAIGAKLPKGALLVGPPGTGKTLLAKAVAGEAGVPFFSLSGSDFVEMFVGVGASRVRDLFKQAQQMAPCIIFIDEIDAVGKARGNTRSDEREATLNQLLTEMDGFEDSSGVIVIAATNKMEVLDEALLRSGRFDRRIYVELPNLQEREHILGLYLKDKKHELDIEEVARLCVGFSGAALASLVNESALNALRRKSNVIQKEDILATKDKVLTGKKKALSLNEKEKEILALYQSAKALSAYWLEVDFDKIGLVSESFRQIDKELTSKQELMSKIKVALSGNIAVECIYKQTFSNAKEDILSAKEIATQMCEQYGMGERLLSDSSDIAHILEQAQKEMREFIINSKAVLLQISRALQERERLSKDEIQEIYESIHK